MSFMCWVLLLHLVVLSMLPALRALAWLHFVCLAAVGELCWSLLLWSASLCVVFVWALLTSNRSRALASFNSTAA
jgi:hypothetical protein